jgi:DUF3108-like
MRKIHLSQFLYKQYNAWVIYFRIPNMKHNKALLALVFIISSLLLSACRASVPQSTQPPTSQAPNTGATVAVTPTTASSLCANPYFPNNTGVTSEYDGNNSIGVAYKRTDTITDLRSDGFTQETTQNDVTYSVEYTCTDAGLISMDPIQQYITAIIGSTNGTVSVQLLSNSGISLPVKFNLGDSWRQTVDWEATAPNLTTRGRLVFEYQAMGNENITVPFGTFDAMRIDTTIKIEVGGIGFPVGTYSITSWLVPGVGLVKSEGTSHLPRFEYTDSMELTSFISTP